MKEEFNVELRPDKFYFSKWLLILIIGLLIGLIFPYIQYIKEYPFYIYIISGMIIVYGLILTQEKKFLLIDGKNFIIETRLINRIKLKKYKIENITNVKYRQNVKSNIYSSTGSVKVGGIDLTPESMKEYYYHNEILSFEYEGEKVEIGMWKKEFDGKNLVRIIENIKNN
jgi:hypothetical protein